jgi:ectoine hydroxylase-related dioxygenase (phytanoyl-CoA dioxygenase family)
VDDHFQEFRASGTLPHEALKTLVESGFVTIPGPISKSRFRELETEYDRMMTAGSGPDFRIGSNTTRMSNVLDHSLAFDELFSYPPLLEACGHLIGEPFKLSSLIARTLRAETPAQELHSDVARDSGDAPLIGFIFMIDPFHEGNGATRFVPASHRWPSLPSECLSDTRSTCPGEMLCCGRRGMMIIFNGATWHGHTANTTMHPRRSIQGYFVRRSAQSATSFRNGSIPRVFSRMNAAARYLLALDEPTAVTRTWQH